VSQEASDRKDAIAEPHQTLKAEAAELRRLLDTKDHETAAIDARGLPVIGFGIVLSGVPEALASIPWYLGWLLPAAGLGATIVMVVHTVKAHRRSRAVSQSNGNQ
jgi:hypothetical protein